MQRQREIYQWCKQSVSKGLQTLQGHRGDQEFEKIKASTLQIIEPKRIKLFESLELLQEGAEWEKLNIAFFGETNAGKSSLIEALRLFFKESTKCKEQEDFKEAQNHLVDLEKEWHTTMEQLRQLENAHAQKRRSLWYRFWVWLGLHSTPKKIVDLQLQAKQLQEERTQCLVQYSYIADGAIIGDGRSDFTQKFTRYEFKVSGISFVLLDVPGIEGRETGVQEEIRRAVRKSHVVFYISSESTPPQTGDANKPGTLQKIKEYLGDLSVVYTIFNKRVTNPIYLKKALVSQDEAKSLEVLDTKMAEILDQEHYGGHKSVCAFVAFLALAECLWVEQDAKQQEFFTNKQKFLKEHTSAELLEWAGFEQLCAFISQDLMVGVRKRIKSANYHKVFVALMECVQALLELEKQMEDLIDALEKEIQSTTQQLQMILQGVQRRLEGLMGSILDSFETATRNKAYAYIESDVKDSEFKERVGVILKEESEHLSQTLGGEITTHMEAFQQEVVTNLKNFKRRVDVVEMDYQKAFYWDGHTQQDLRTDSGIDGWGLVGALAGAGGVWAFIATTNFWNPLGWTVIIAGVLGALLAGIKSVFKFFSKSYKQAEQRKAFDRAIKRVVEEIKAQVDENLKSIKEEATRYIEQCEQALYSVLHQRKKVREHIQQIALEWENIAQEIKLAGDKWCKRL